MLPPLQRSKVWFGFWLLLSSKSTILTCEAQPTELWRWRDGSEFNDYAEDAKVDATGDLLLCGSSFVNSEYSAGVVFKLSGIDGSTLWKFERNVDIGCMSACSHTFTGLDIDNNGDIIVGGTSGDIFTLTKLDGDTGSVLWTWADEPIAEEMSGPDRRYDIGAKIARDDEGNVYLSGYTNGTLEGAISNVGGYDFAVIKLNENTRSLVWQWQGGSEENDVSRGLAVDPDGSVTIGGETYGCIGADLCGKGWDHAAVRLSAEGVELWRYQGSLNLDERVYAVARSASGGTILVGATVQLDYTYGDNFFVYALELDASGEAVHDYHGNTVFHDDVGAGVAVDPENGDVVIVGRSSGDWAGPVDGSFNFIAVRVTEGLGDTAWMWQDGTERDDLATAVAFDSMGSLFIAGRSYGDWMGTNAGFSDFAVIKLQDTFAPAASPASPPPAPSTPVASTASPASPPPAPSTPVASTATPVIPDGSNAATLAVDTTTALLCLLGAPLLRPWLLA